MRSASRSTTSAIERTTASALLGAVLTALAGAQVGRADDLAWTGTVALRTDATAPSASSITPLNDLPMFVSIAEANVTTRAALFSEQLHLVLDASVIDRRGIGFVRAHDNKLVTVDNHDVTTQRPSFVFSEASARWSPVSHVVLSAGKMRVVWGTGIAFNPTDVLNPARDPTNPSLQRAGRLMARVDVPYENLTATVLVAPSVLHEELGVPLLVGVHPAWQVTGAPARDDVLHYAAAARVYLLVVDTDVNVWTVWQNRDLNATDAGVFENKARVMASGARMLSDSLEGHVEVMMQTGSDRLFADPACVSSDARLRACALGSTPVVARNKLDSTAVLPRILLGLRLLPDDESMLTAEYLYAADGMMPAELSDLAQLRARAARLGLNPQAGGPSTAAAGTPTQVRFDVLRRHYVFLNGQRSRIHDDLTVSAGAIVAAEDLSALVSARSSWLTTEWLELSASAYAPTPSLLRLSHDLRADDPLDGARWPTAARVEGTPYGVFDGAPFVARLSLEARATF